MPQHTPTRSEGGIRRGPRRADQFTILSNDVLNDKRLSFRARGVLIWLLSKPADWRTRSESIAAQSDKDGRDSIRSAMRELAELGYLVREKTQDETTGRWSTTSTVYEEPITAVDGDVPPKPENPIPGRASVGKRGAKPSTDLQRTKTNQPSRKAATSPADTKPESVVVDPPSKINKPSTEQLALVDALAAASQKANLTATFRHLKPHHITAIAALVETHGVPNLVAHVKALHNPVNATRFASGWIPMWQEMPLPKAALAPKCDDCDEYGWLPDNELGEAVKCDCRTRSTGTRRSTTTSRSAR